MDFTTFAIATPYILFVLGALVYFLRKKDVITDSDHDVLTQVRTAFEQFKETIAEFAKEKKADHDLLTEININVKRIDASLKSGSTRMDCIEKEAEIAEHWLMNHDKALEKMSIFHTMNHKGIQGDNSDFDIKNLLGKPKI